MRQSDVQRQIDRLLQSQYLYMRQWSRLAKLRIMQGKDPIVRFRRSAKVPVPADYAPDSILAESIRQAERQAAADTCRQIVEALQAGARREAERQAAERQAAEQAAEQAAGVKVDPAIRFIVQTAIGHARLVAGRQAEHKQDRARVSRHGRSKGIEAKSMHPASDIAKLASPRHSASLTRQAVFYRDSAGDTDYSLSGGRLLRATPHAGLWLKVSDSGRRQTSKAERQAETEQAETLAAAAGLGIPVTLQADTQAPAGCMFGSLTPRQASVLGGSVKAIRTEYDDCGEAERRQAAGKADKAAAAAAVLKAIR